MTVLFCYVKCPLKVCKEYDEADEVIRQLQPDNKRRQLRNGVLLLLHLLADYSKRERVEDSHLAVYLKSPFFPWSSFVRKAEEELLKPSVLQRVEQYRLKKENAENKEEVKEAESNEDEQEQKDEDGPRTRAVVARKVGHDGKDVYQVLYSGGRQRDLRRWTTVDQLDDHLREQANSIAIDPPAVPVRPPPSAIAEPAALIADPAAAVADPAAVVADPAPAIAAPAIAAPAVIDEFIAGPPASIADPPAVIDEPIADLPPVVDEPDIKEQKMKEPEVKEEDVKPRRNGRHKNTEQELEVNEQVREEKAMEELDGISNTQDRLGFYV